MKLHNLKYILMVFLTSFLFGCSSGKIVKTYEGDLVKDQAVLTAPEHIVVISVNGEKVPKYLLSSINVNYGLKPGSNLVVFQYESVWAKSKRDDKDDPRSEEIVSDRKEVLVNAKAGEKYTFAVAGVENVREARELVSAFSADVVSASGDVVATSADLGTHQLASKAPVKADSQAQVAPIVAVSGSQNVAVSSGAAVGADVNVSSTAPVAAPVLAQSKPLSADLPAIDGLKILWQSATAEEKKAFLKWAFK